MNRHSTSLIVPLPTCQQFPLSGQSLLQHGKVNFTVVSPSLLHCRTVQYPQAFSSSRNIRVLASISHQNESLSVHDSAVVWTTDVTQNSFRICVLESGLGTNGSAVVNWIAFRGTPSGALDGAASFNAFTSGTKCERVDFAQVWFQFIVYFFLFERSKFIFYKPRGFLRTDEIFHRVSYIGWGWLLGGS